MSGLNDKLRKPPQNLHPPSIYISYSINFTLKYALHHRIGNNLSSFCETIKRVYVLILTSNIGSAPQLLDNYCSNRKYVGKFLTQIKICRICDGLYDIFILFCNDPNKLFSFRMDIFFSKQEVILKRLGISTDYKPR